MERVRVIVHEPQKVNVKISAFTGEPTGEIVLTENHQTYNVKAFATAKTEIPGPVLIDVELKKNGTYTAEEFQAEGIKKVEVALPFEQKEVTPSTIQQTVTPTPDTEYQALSEVIVHPAPLEHLDVTPDTTEHTYTPQAPAIGFSDVTVDAVPPSSFDAFVSGESNFVESNVTIVVEGRIGNAVQSISLPEALTIGDSAFYTHTNLQSANMPKVLTIDTNAFYTCQSLQSVYMPKVTSISAGAFRGCRALESLELPEGLNNIGARAFQDCVGLVSVDMTKLLSVLTVNATSFTNTTCVFLFRDQTQLDAYAAAKNWSTYASRFQIKGA